MLLLYWTVLKEQRATNGEPAMSPPIVLAALAAATAIPGVYAVLGFDIARHCTRTDYVTLVFVLTIVAHIACYGLMVWGGLMRAIVAMTAKMFDRQWRSSWLLTAAPPTVLILIGLTIRWIDDLYRTAASEGRTIGELVTTMLVALGALWAWIKGDDTNGSKSDSAPSSPQGARIAPIYGNNNTVIQGDIDGRDFYFR
jgi:purine-cytosine permease-like protein